MKKYSILPILLSLALVGCGSTRLPDQSLMDNPLFVERYADEIVSSFTEMEIQKDPIMEDESKKDFIKSAKTKWLRVAKEATADQLEGKIGHFLKWEEFAMGEVLFTYPKLYIGPTFETTPGPNLHLYLTTEVDPREIEFPDETAIDIGTPVSPYGAQTYEVPENGRSFSIPHCSVVG